MDTKKIKSSELVIIQKILAWQVAQVLGSQSEEELKKHAMLLAVDYEDDTFFPLMIGEDFDIYITEEVGTWEKRYTHIVDTYIKTEKENARHFFGKEAAIEKWSDKTEFDSFDFVSSIRGEPKWTHAVQHLFHRDGHLSAIFWLVEIDNFRKSQTAISFLAKHDALTGLYNRYHLNNIIDELKKSNQQNEVYYVFADLDNFKSVNDNYGHSNGDLALIAMSKRLEEVFFHKTNDIIFRLGGDEFLVIVKDLNEESLVNKLKELNKPIPVTLDDGRVIEVLTSIGYSHDIDSADKALYYVKKNGKNHFHKGE